MDLMAIDLGTSSVKVTITNAETGEVEAAGKQGYCLYTPKHGFVETDPTIWWTSTILAIKECFAEYSKKSDQIGAIGLTGQMHGVVPVDKKNRELYNCILYSDSRSDSVVKNFPDDVRQELEYGGCNPLTSMMSAPKLLWIKLHEKEIWDETYKWVMPKDYIRMKLTDYIATDISDASGTSMMNYETYDWMPSVERVGLELDKFPEIRKSHEVVSVTTRQTESLTGIKAGTPVVGGGADMACTALGTGAIESGIASITIGSAGHIIVPTKQVNREHIFKYYQMCHVIPDTFYAFGPLLSGGISFSWLKDRLLEVAEGLTFSQLDAFADQSGIGSSGLFFLPYLAGAIIPHSNPRARGAYVGLSLQNTTGDMVRSIMEGVAYGCRDIIEVITKSDVPIKQCNFGEGGSRSTLWCSILSAVFGYEEYSVMKNKDSAPVGSTILAGMGIGVYSSWKDAVAKLTGTTTRRVDKKSIEEYDKYYKIYQKLYPALEGVLGDIDRLPEC